MSRYKSIITSIFVLGLSLGLSLMAIKPTMVAAAADFTLSQRSPTSQPAQSDDDLIKQVLGAKSDAHVLIQKKSRTGEWITRHDNAEGTSAGLHLMGSDQKDKFDTTPPKASLVDAGDAAAGASSIMSAITTPPLSLNEAKSSALFWFGILIILGGVACFWAPWPPLKAHAIFIIAGGCCTLAISFFPGLLIPLFILGVGIMAYPLINTAIQKHKSDLAAAAAKSDANDHKEAVRALVAAVDAPSVPSSAAAAVNSALNHIADDKDRAVIAAVKAQDGIQPQPVTTGPSHLELTLTNLLNKLTTQPAPPPTTTTTTTQT